jgi:tRNA A58 N-methylase Trm61
VVHQSQQGKSLIVSCETQLITTIQDIAKNLSEGKQVDAILLDFSKAFDKVPHERLLLKLHHYGIRGLTLQWIKNFL